MHANHALACIDQDLFLTDTCFSECIQLLYEKKALIMPSGSKKSRPQSARAASKSKRKRSSKKRSVSAKASKTDVDILSPAAMENVYYISHNAVDCLEFRGFGWPGATKKKGKKSKK